MKSTVFTRNDWTSIETRYIVMQSQSRAYQGGWTNEKGVYIPYTKHTGRFTFMPAGVIPAVRPHSRHDFTLCGIDPVFVSRVADEMDRMPQEKPRFQTEIKDINLYHLVKLLSAEAAQGGPLGRLYADHLAHALDKVRIETRSRTTCVATEAKNKNIRNKPDFSDCSGGGYRLAAWMHSKASQHRIW